MKENIKISVVIPLYNKQKYIKKAIKSVLEQEYEHFEVIVVDDGSKDQSCAEAEKMKDERLHIIKQENQGVSVARNTGIYAAKGEYIAFLDADDFWDKHYLKTINHLIDHYPESDIFVTAYRVLLEDGKIKNSIQKTPAEGCLDSYWITLGGGYDFVWTSATTIRKSTLLEAGCFVPGEKAGQDLDMWARVARINPKVAYSSKISVTYNRGAEENARTRNKIGDAKAFIKDLEEELENKKHTSDELAAIQHKYDLKMIVLIFTLIIAGEKKRAIKEMKRWKIKHNLKSFILMTLLKIAWIMPNFVNQFVYRIRLKVF